MQFARILRSLSVPALAIAAGITLACAESATTAPNQSPAISAAAGGRLQYVDDNGQYYCKANYSLVYSGSSSYSIHDLNQNGYICQYNKGNSTGKPLTIDDDGNLACPNGYVLATTPSGDYWDLWDFNANDHVCKLVS